VALGGVKSAVERAGTVALLDPVADVPDPRVVVVAVHDVDLLVTGGGDMITT